MKTASFALIALSLVALASGIAVAAEKKAKPDLGAKIYTESCAVCHGATAKGNGYGVEFLTKRPSNLTVLSKNNAGVFPFERIYFVIDGRVEVKGHGPRDMPIWGQKFSAESGKAAEYYVDVPYDMEMYARSRILAVIDYLHRIQEK